VLEAGAIKEEVGFELETIMSPVHKVMARANARAERLRAVMVELAGLSANKAAAVLNERRVPALLGGGRWYRAQVIRLRNRLAETAPPP
jgi:hypothetical protein